MENQEIKDALGSLFSAFQKESDTENAEWIETILTKYAHLDLSNPEDFSLATSLTLDKQLDLLARVVLQSTILDRTTKHRLQFVYTQYDFMVRHLKKIIYAYEGNVCSTDKTRWLINAYVQFLKTGNTIVITKQKYYHPKAGEVSQWFHFMSQMYSLYYGDVEEYSEAKKVLVESYISRHAQHRSNLDTYFRKDSRFIHDIPEEGEEGTPTYYFEDPYSGDSAFVFVNELAQISYRFFIQSENRNANFRDDLPEWFETLLDSAND